MPPHCATVNGIYALATGRTVAECLAGQWRTSLPTTLPPSSILHHLSCWPRTINPILGLDHDVSSSGGLQIDVQIVASGLWSAPTRSVSRSRSPALKNVLPDFDNLSPQTQANGPYISIVQARLHSPRFPGQGVDTSHHSSTSTARSALEQTIEILHSHGHRETDTSDIYLRRYLVASLDVDIDILSCISYISFHLYISFNSQVWHHGFHIDIIPFCAPATTSQVESEEAEDI